MLPRLNQLSTWQKSISNAHFVVFLSRRCQNAENVHETFLNTKIPFQKRTFYDHRVQNVPQVSSETSLPRLVQNKPSALICREENKVEFLERQFHSDKLSFVHKKESEHSWTFSFHLCILSAIFNLEMQNFSLESYHMMNASSHFVDGWHLLGCQIRRLPPHPLCGCPYNFCGEGIWVV